MCVCVCVGWGGVRGREPLPAWGGACGGRLACGWRVLCAGVVPGGGPGQAVAAPGGGGWRAGLKG